MLKAALTITIRTYAHPCHGSTVLTAVCYSFSIDTTAKAEASFVNNLCTTSFRAKYFMNENFFYYEVIYKLLYDVYVVERQLRIRTFRGVVHVDYIECAEILETLYTYNLCTYIDNTDWQIMPLFITMCQINSHFLTVPSKRYVT